MNAAKHETWAVCETETRIAIKAGNRTIAYVQMNAADEDRAHLIAAAPELLDVVRLLVHVQAHGPHDPSPLDENSPLMDAARDALAKAEGRS